MHETLYILNVPMGKPGQKQGQNFEGGHQPPWPVQLEQSLCSFKGSFRVRFKCRVSVFGFRSLGSIT